MKGGHFMIKTVNNIINDFKEFVCDMFPYNVRECVPTVEFNMNCGDINVRDKFGNQVERDEVTATYDLNNAPFDGIRLNIYIYKNEYFCEMCWSRNKGTSWWTDGSNLSIIQKDIVKEMKNKAKYLNGHYE